MESQNHPQATNPETQNSKPETGNSKLTPSSLLKKLQTSPNLSPDKLLSHFNCSLEELSAAMADPEFLTHHKLQTQLSFFQSRLLCHKFVTHAMAKTVELMNEAEKPEVARRAAASLIQMAGLPIRTAPQPAPLLFPEPTAPAAAAETPDELDPDQQELIEAMDGAAFVLGLKRSKGIDLSYLHDHHRDDLDDALREFFTKHNLPWTWGLMAPVYDGAPVNVWPTPPDPRDPPPAAAPPAGVPPLGGPNPVNQ